MRPYLERSLLATLCNLLLSAAVPAQSSPNQDDQACATSTRNGVSLLATVRASAVTLKLGTSPEALVLTLPPSIPPAATRITGTNTCTLVLNAAEDEAAIGIPLTPEPDSPLAAVEIARFNLTQKTLQTPITIAPPPPLPTLLSGQYRNSMRLIGYRANSSELLLAASDQRLTALTQDGRQAATPTNLTPSLFDSPTAISATDNRFWSTCDQEPLLLGKPKPCSLVATTLLGAESPAIKVLSPVLKPQPNVLQWANPEFYADLGQTLLFASYPAAGPSSAHTLWSANLNDGTIHQLAIPARFNDAALTGNFAVSADHAVMALSISRTRLATVPVNTYVSLGDRIVVLDLTAHKVLAEIRPINQKSALALAITHTPAKTTLLVDWGNGWQEEDLPKE